MFTHFLPDGKPLLVFAQGFVVLHKFAFTRLDREVGLREGNGMLARIAIHRDEVAGVAGEVKVLQFACASIGHGRCFGGTDKMQRSLITAGFTGFFRLVNYALELPPFGIFKDWLKFSRRPVFPPLLIEMLDALEQRFTHFLDVCHWNPPHVVGRRAADVPLSLRL